MSSFALQPSLQVRMHAAILFAFDLIYFAILLFFPF